MPPGTKGLLQEGLTPQLVKQTDLPPYDDAELPQWKSSCKHEHAVARLLD